MRDIIKYTEVKGNSKNDLIDKVNSLIKEGWQPLPGLTLKAYPTTPSDFHQSMVKYKPEKTNSI